MHHFIAEIKQSKISAVGSFRKQAEAIYNENLTAYVKLVMRRPFAKIIVRFSFSGRRGALNGSIGLLRRG